MKRSTLTFFILSLSAESLLNYVEAIIGGDVSKPGQFKYILSVQLNRQHTCMGSIIRENFALSGGHCIIDKNNMFKKGSLSVVPGIVEIRGQESSSDKSLRIKVNRAFVPSTFDNRPNDLNIYYGDLSILWVEKGFGLTKTRNLIKLDLPTFQDQEPMFDRVSAVLAGFGVETISVKMNEKTEQQEEFGPILPQRLKHADTFVYPVNLCTVDQKVAPYLVCAKMEQRNPSKPEGACLGDSGGSLVVRGKIVIGVLSGSPIGCVENVEPSVYTRITFFKDFINDVLENRLSNEIRSKDYPNL